MDLVRNQWRKYTRGITGAIDEPIIIQPPFSDLKFDLNAVNFEDNSAKIPINYVLPKGFAWNVPSAHIRRPSKTNSR
jgi:cell surface protein SprA